MPVKLRPIGVFILLLVLVALEGCGFRLRGSLGEYESIPPVHVQGTDPAVIDLRQFLRSGGSEVVGDPAQAGLIVTVDEVVRSRRALSIGARGRIEEYELIYQLRFRAEDDEGDPMIADEVVTQTRNFAFDETDVVAKSGEEEFLYREMQRSAVMQVMRRLQSLDFEAADEVADEVAQ